MAAPPSTTASAPPPAPDGTASARPKRRRLRRLGRILAAALMFAGAYVGCVLARGAIDLRAGSGSTPSISSADKHTQELPYWVTESHPPRYGQADCTIDTTIDMQKLKSQPADFVSITTCRWAVTFARTDPLVPRLRTGAAHQSPSTERLAQYLVWANKNFPRSEPVLEYASNSPTAVLRFTECQSSARYVPEPPRYVPESEFESESPSNQPGIVTDNRLTSVEDLDSAGARNALIESLKLTVRISHATIASMTGVPVRQDATTAVFDGPPTALSVRIWPDPSERQ